MTLESSGHNPVEVLVRVDEEEAMEAYDRHAAFNPDLHDPERHPPG